jgi:hypothetical protein
MMDYQKTDGGVLVPVGGLRVGGVFKGEIVRKGEVIEEFEDHNLIVSEGLDAILNIMFHGSTQLTTFYCGIFVGNYTPVATVTAATIASASTESTAYTESTRPEYVEAAASGQSITNSANKATFTSNATQTIYGAFLISDSTKSGTTGTLFAAARFSTEKKVDSGDQLLLTYTLAASSV